jgi:hypothetical protein
MNAAPYLRRTSLRKPESSQIKESSQHVKCLAICCLYWTELGRELSEQRKVMLEEQLWELGGQRRYLCRSQSGRKLSG